ncbi:hypothetical protein Salat_1043800 [Sesamum alatum]|uniref:DUF4283 domain-containing protein n=1 Tax=Sesamum alatum TaxID=300844 RepID=A0AAE2CSD9_9LAMI|nr:hypothetical protein Salat_1043800 [Sesamum alatum]
MAEELGKMKEVLGLSELEQRSVMVPLGSWQGDSEVPSFFMVGRLLSRRSFNFEALKNTLMNVFNPIKGLGIRLIENSRILFNFAHTLDRKRDLLPFGPWLRATSPAILRSRNTTTPVPRPSFTPQTSPPTISPALSKRGSTIFNYSVTPSSTAAPPINLTPISSPPLSNTCPPPYTSSLLTSPPTRSNTQTFQPQTSSIISPINSTIPSLNPTAIPIIVNHPSNVVET